VQNNQSSDAKNEYQNVKQTLFVLHVAKRATPQKIAPSLVWMIRLMMKRGATAKPSKA
jgi:hypothetical protein